MSDETTIETGNDFWFGSNGESIAPMLPIVITSREQAYRTAAWIEIMGMTLPSSSEVTYEQVREAILNV